MTNKDKFAIGVGLILVIVLKDLAPAIADKLVQTILYGSAAFILLIVVGYLAVLNSKRNTK